MKPQIAVDIIARDKTADGQKAAERRFGSFAKRTDAFAKDSGFGRLGKQMESLKKLGSVDFGSGFGKAGESLARIGETSQSAAREAHAATSGLIGLASAGEGAFGAIAETAGLAAGAVAGVGVAVAGVAAATYALGDKWSKIGGEVGRTAKTLGVSTDTLQTTRAAWARFGVTADQTTASLDGFTQSIYDAQYGTNNRGLAALSALGVTLKIGKNGAVDYAAALDDVSDAIAKQTNPGTQRELAKVWGFGEGALPALRQGSSALKAEREDFRKSGAELDDAQTEAAERTERNTTALKQNLGKFEKMAGMAAMGPTDAAAQTGRALLSNPRGAAAKAWSSTEHVIEGLSTAGASAARDLVHGGMEAGRAIGEEFKRFTDRIEHQESRGRQFDRTGAVLTSSAGAVGDMQLLPATAMRAARSAGIAWDPQKFRTDKAYNKQIGDAELARLLKEFGGDEFLAAAAYNAGEGALLGHRKNGRRVPGWLKTIGDPRTGAISDEDFASRIPYAETRDYVAKTAHAHVTIDLHGAPVGTLANAKGGPGVDVSVNVHHALAADP